MGFEHGTYEPCRGNQTYVRFQASKTVSTVAFPVLPAPGSPQYIPIDKELFVRRSQPVTTPFRILLTVALLALPPVLRAAAEHEEYRLEADPGLTLSGLLDRAVEHHPEQVLLAAGQNRARAESEFSDKWFPEAAELGGFHLSDRQFDDIGAYENEVALNLPLWLPGEKKAQTAYGEAMSTMAASKQVQFRWQVAALVRRQLWGTALAKRLWEVALEQEQRLEKVLEQVIDLAEAGDLSRADQLATMQELALWKAETMTLEAAYQDAIREYRTLTGMERIPADISEPLSEREVIGDDHPALQMAMHELAAVDASAEVAQQTGTVRPSVQLFWRGYRGDRAAPDVNALGLGVAIPLGRSPSRGPQIARANEDLARAHARLTELRRMLDLNLHEARHQLHTSRRQLENSTAMVEAAAERHRLDQLAFELGEFSLREWLRRLSETRKIQQSHELLLMQQGAAIASYNQAVGETP